MILKIIIGLYCLVGLTYNLFILPKRNKEIYEENKIIIERYKRMDGLMDRFEEYLNKNGF